MDIDYVDLEHFDCNNTKIQTSLNSIMSQKLNCDMSAFLDHQNLVLLFGSYFCSQWTESMHCDCKKLKKIVDSHLLTLETNSEQEIRLKTLNALHGYLLFKSSVQILCESNFSLIVGNMYANTQKDELHIRNKILSLVSCIVSFESNFIKLLEQKSLVEDYENLRNNQESVKNLPKEMIRVDDEDEPDDFYSD